MSVPLGAPMDEGLVWAAAFAAKMVETLPFKLTERDRAMEARILGTQAADVTDQVLDAYQILKMLGRP